MQSRETGKVGIMIEGVMTRAEIWERKVQSYAAGFEAGGAGCEPRKAGGLRKLEKSRKRINHRHL